MQPIASSGQALPLTVERAENKEEEGDDLLFQAFDRSLKPNEDSDELFLEKEGDRAEPHINRMQRHSGTSDVYYAARNYFLSRDEFPGEIEAVKKLCRNGKYPEPEIMSSWLKNSQWFNCLTVLHYAGRPTESYSDDQLGLTQYEGVFRQNSFYRAVLNKLRECYGCRSYECYQQFMNWLIQLDTITDANPPLSIIDHLTQGYKSIRPELCESLGGEVENSLISLYDPNHTFYGASITRYPIRFFYLKSSVIKSMLNYAPDDYAIRLASDWLNAGEFQAIRQGIFQQNYYPLNTFHHECYPWNLILEAMSHFLPDVQGGVLHEKMSEAFVFPESLADFDQPLNIRNVDFCFGRTLKKRVDSKNIYIKIQLKNESDDDFYRSFARLKVIHEMRDEAGLESTCVTPGSLFWIDVPQQFLNDSALSEQDKKSVLNLTGCELRLAMVFETPEDIDYEQYVYDVSQPDHLKAGLATYARDYGRLWKRGLLGPPAINAFHCGRDRAYITIAPFAGHYSEGCLDSWNQEATNHPNGDCNLNCVNACR